MNHKVISIVAFVFLLCAPAVCQEYHVFDPGDPEPPRMLSSYLRRIAADQLAERRRLIEQIRTSEQFEKRRSEVRANIVKLIGGLPEERTPLNLRRTGRLDREGYRIEKVIYESLPNFYITASLYIPTTGKPPYPALLQPLGHTTSGKAGGMYQSLSIGLARLGFVVLTFDPIGQGERRVFWDEDLMDSKVGGPTAEHSMVGRQNLLAGESVARYRIWDGIRGIDVLESLPEVDAKRIAVAGCSGGGTLTAYISALDERVAAAAPACYISSWEEQLQGTGPQDAEQQFADQLLLGINHADFATAMAPKPYLICSTTDDFFPIDGARRTYNEAKRIYSLFGAEEKVGWFVGPGGHGMRQDTREAIYAWLNRWLKGAPEGSVPEPQHRLEGEEDLLATETGQVASSLGGETASTWNIKRFREMKPSRPRIASRQDLEHFRARVREEVLRSTRYTPSRDALNIQSKGVVRGKGYTAERLVYAAGGGRLVPALLLTPDAGLSRNKAVLYLDQEGKSRQNEPAPDAVQLARLGYTVLALDPAGIGETAVRTQAKQPATYASHGTVWLALMVGRPLVGLRMDDIVRGLDVLGERKLFHGGGAVGFAKGLIGVSLLHAAAIDERFEGVVLEGSLVSYRAVAEAPIHRQIAEAIIPGVLDRYDLPDLAAALAGRRVWISNAASPLLQPVLLREAEAAYDYAARVHAAFADGSLLRIGQRRTQDSVEAAYPELR